MTESMLHEVKRVEAEIDHTGEGDIVEDGVVVRTLQEVQEYKYHFFKSVHEYIQERFDHEALEPFELTGNKTSSMLMDAELWKKKYDDEHAAQTLELSKKHAEIEAFKEEMKAKTEAAKRLEDIKVRMAEEDLRAKQLQNRHEEMELSERETKLKESQLELSQKGLTFDTLK
ncbi:hypothetical protein BGZ83_004451 [Gryganskiella cystojenkinii]|nr:hypothetical protein BGZ83_004451 [Gryganskiella cystojenkinii]